MRQVLSTIQTSGLPTFRIYRLCLVPSWDEMSKRLKKVQKRATKLIIITIIIFMPSDVKIPRVKSKVKSKKKSWSGHSSSLEKLLWSKLELKRWTVIEMHWKRKLGSRLSSEIHAVLRPSSEKKAIDNSFNGPSVSAAIDWNRRPVCAKRSYLAVF